MIEKKIRLKYLVPLESSRANKLRASWNTEVEGVLEDYKKKYRAVHKQRRSVEEFDKKISQMLAGAKILVDTEVTNLKHKLGKDIGTSERFSPSELSKIRSEEHTSELQSQAYLVCRLLLEKKKKK
mgnify:CR=1 FL=1